MIYGIDLGCCLEHPEGSLELLLRKEVIQPQVPLRLPCYDFTPITNHTVGACLLVKRLAQRLLVQSTFRV
jgi:hypothetical protein